MPALDIPASAFEADERLGDRPFVALDSRTRLVRQSGEVCMLYGEREGDRVRLVRWHRDGAMTIYPGYAAEWSRAQYERIALALPDDWAVVAASRHPRRRARLIYRNAYEVALQRLTFRPNGDVTFYGGDRITLDMLEQEAAERGGYIVPPRTRPTHTGFPVHMDAVGVDMAAGRSFTVSIEWLNGLVYTLQEVR